MVSVSVQLGFLLTLNCAPWVDLAVEIVASTCEPLCQYELDREMICALESGCYDDSVISNDELFQMCFKPCWNNPEINCLNVCKRNYHDISVDCAARCVHQPTGNHFCTSFCFAMALDSIVKGGLSGPSSPGHASAHSSGNGVLHNGPPGTFTSIASPGIPANEWDGVPPSSEDDSAAALELTTVEYATPANTPKPSWTRRPLAPPRLSPAD